MRGGRGEDPRGEDLSIEPALEEGDVGHGASMKDGDEHVSPAPFEPHLQIGSVHSRSTTRDRCRDARSAAALSSSAKQGKGF